MVRNADDTPTRAQRVRQQPGRTELALLIGQIFLTILGMSAYWLAPRAQETAVLVPLTGTAATALPVLLSQPGVMILSRGQLQGSYVIGGDTPSFFDALLGSGVLILNGSAPGCGPPTGAYSAKGAAA